MELAVQGWAGSMAISNIVSMQFSLRATGDSQSQSERGRCSGWPRSSDNTGSQRGARRLRSLGVSHRDTIDYLEDCILTGANQPDGALRLREQSAAGEEGDLRATARVKIVICEPHPHALLNRDNSSTAADATV